MNESRQWKLAYKQCSEILDSLDKNAQMKIISQLRRTYSAKQPTLEKEKKDNSFAIGASIVLLLMALYFFYVIMFVGKPDGAGTFGDMFGGINALFTGLAFVGLIVTIRQQKEQLELQRKELADTRNKIIGVEETNTKSKFKRMEAAAKKRYSLAEYQQLEEDTGIRYEYHDGEVFAMAGGSPEHSAIATNISDLLRGNLPTGCRRFNSDLKVYVPTVDKSFHPDLTVACRPIEKPTEMNAISNPVLLVEVLSKSTADYDRGQKFWYFSQLPSLREYVLIEQDRWAVETRYRKSAESQWVMEYHQGDTEVMLRSLDLRLPIHQIYEDIEGL